MNAQPDAVGAERARAAPPMAEFTAAWSAYALFGVAVFLWWPGLLALIINYSKRNSATAGFIGSHHRWLIRTFWWSLAGYGTALAVLAAGIWPLARDLLRTAAGPGHGQWHANTLINIDWSSIFATVGGAMLGGVSLLAVWIWFIYRVLRGALRLADAQPAP